MCYNRCPVRQSYASNTSTAAKPYLNIVLLMTSKMLPLGFLVSIFVSVVAVAFAENRKKVD